MGLLDLKTDLKSLKFGKDRPGGGDSGQPYIKNPLQENVAPQTTDFLLRGGMDSPIDALTDVARLGKMFKDLKSPNGLLFIAKQNILSSTSVKTQASRKTQPNAGIYTPLNTLAQAGIGFQGGHINKQGIPGGEIRTYSSLAKPGAFISSRGIPDFNLITGEPNFPETLPDRSLNIIDEASNRLAQLAKIKIGTLYESTQFIQNRTQISPDPNFILRYGGGPGSDLGFGKTNIAIATSNTGVPLTTIYNNDRGFGLNNPLLKFKTWSSKNIIALDTGIDGDPYRENQSQWLPNDSVNLYQSTIQNFQSPLLKDVRPEGSAFEREKSSRIMSLSPSYNPGDNKTLDNSEGTSRVNYRSPGSPGNILSYTKGKRVWDATSNSWVTLGAVDRINSFPVYTSEEEINPTELKVNDLINFRISALNSRNPNSKDHIFFRAYIDSFQDKYSAKWKGIDYTGRGESFYKYGGFDRSISLAFTVAAQSKEELLEQYRKLNFLASNLAPDYSAAGYMGGSLVELTLGGWCFELPGFISSLALDVPQESPWEIGINDEGNFDENTSQLPHIVKVTGFSFTPIHRFRPAKQIDSENGSYDSFAPEQYISLTNSDGIDLHSGTIDLEGEDVD